MPFSGDTPSTEEVFEPVTIGVSLGLLVLLGIITIGMVYTWSTLAPAQQSALGDLIQSWINSLDMSSSSKEQEKSNEESGEKVEYKTKKKVKGKQKDDIPDRFKGEKPFKGESGKEAAKRVLEKRGEYDPKDTGPRSNFNKLKKYFDTHFQ